MACRTRSITREDMTAALEDMHNIKSRLQVHLNDAPNWTAPDVGIACYLFYFMVEVAWTLFFYAAGGRKPDPLSKVAVTPCSFKVPVRSTSAKRYDLPVPLKDLPARDQLVKLMTSLVLPRRLCLTKATTREPSRTTWWLTGCMH
jgi:hypothetical protein